MKTTMTTTIVAAAVAFGVATAIFAPKQQDAERWQRLAVANGDQAEGTLKALETAQQRIRELEISNAALRDPYRLARKRYAQCVEAFGAARCAEWGKQ